MTTDHLRPETINALVDRELEPTLEAAALLHLEQCHSCTLKVMQAHQLKAAVKKTASTRPQPPADAMQRLTAIAQQQAPKRATITPMRFVAWSALAALLLLAISLGVWQQTRHSNTLSAELLDQHLASLSSSSAPQIISTDRHTVKPWFQGKLPFAFNLPEPTALPPDTTLQGADFTFVEGQPAALLLFVIHTHHVSVFLTQSGSLPNLSPVRSRAGFNVDEAHTVGLDLFAISDVNRADLDALMQVLVKVQ